MGRNPNKTVRRYLDNLRIWQYKKDARGWYVAYAHSHYAPIPVDSPSWVCYCCDMPELDRRVKAGSLQECEDDA